jgi:hypothetical protein
MYAFIRFKLIKLELMSLFDCKNSKIKKAMFGTSQNR